MFASPFCILLLAVLSNTFLYIEVDGRVLQKYFFKVAYGGYYSSKASDVEVFHVASAFLS